MKCLKEKRRYNEYSLLSFSSEINGRNLNEKYCMTLSQRLCVYVYFFQYFPRNTQFEIPFVKEKLSTIEYGVAYPL